MKTIIILCCFFLPQIGNAQKTNTSIVGVSVFKIGDSISKLPDYGYEFAEIFIDPEFDFSDRLQMLDSGKNFCDRSRVFYCEKLIIDEFEFDQGGSLTYFDNKLIDIRLSQIGTGEDKLIDLLKLKYGSTYGKILLAGYQERILKYKSKGVVVTSEIRQHLEKMYLSSIYWTSGTVTLSIGGANKTYDFLDRHYKSPNQAGGGLSVTDDIAYQRMINCSNADYQKKLKMHLKKLSEKADKF